MFRAAADRRAVDGALQSIRPSGIHDPLVAHHRASRVRPLEPRLRLRDGAAESGHAGWRRGDQTLRSPRARIPTSACSAPSASSSRSTRCASSSTSSQFSPSVGRYRVMIIEDADRMVERTSNVLLKALEEPPPRTVWILCAPSEADLIPTIRSRVRSVRLRVPVDRRCRRAARRDADGVDSRARDARRARGAEPHRHGAPAGHQ